MLTFAIRRPSATVASLCVFSFAANFCGVNPAATMMKTAAVVQGSTLRLRSSGTTAQLSQKNNGNNNNNNKSNNSGAGKNNGSGGALHVNGGNSLNSTLGSQLNTVQTNHNGSTATAKMPQSSGSNNKTCGNGGGGGGGNNNGKSAGERGSSSSSSSSSPSSFLKRKEKIKKVLGRTILLKNKKKKLVGATVPPASLLSVQNTTKERGEKSGGGISPTPRGVATNNDSLLPVTASGLINRGSNSTNGGDGRSVQCFRNGRKRSNEKLKKSLSKLRVCVLNSTYEGSNSATADVDDYHCSPEHWVKKEKKRYLFTDVTVRKDDSYRQVRELVTSNKFDVFFNLCDGGRDERRAGVDVVEALEEHNAAFTGTDSHSFEPNKIDMKLLVGAAGVNTPNFVLLENMEGLAKKCRHLRFPVIVKHFSGYASVGIQKDNRCDNLDELKLKVKSFLNDHNHALVEEFIRGREGTVLACSDSSSLFGVKVFKPLMFNFLQNDDDFAYFEKKWTMECDDDAYGFLPHNDPAYPHVIDMARNAFRHIMNGVGYGRIDFRIDQKGDVYFLEINPNCGMWYSEKDGGDFADVMVQGDKSWDHERFIRNAIFRALREQAARRPWYFISHDPRGNFSTRASRKVRAGKSLFSDAAHPIPVIAQALYKLGEENPTVGCVIMRGDRVHQAVAIRHSCEPNMQFMQGRTLTLVAKRTINVGEELTVDYATLCDENMPPFACGCGTSNCRSVIFPLPPTPRTMEGKYVRRMLREKKKAWYKEKEDREAELMLKKRALKGKCCGAAAAASASSATSHSSSPSISSSCSSSTSTSPGISNGSSAPTTSSTNTKK